jgi:hypothetical protein
MIVLNEFDIPADSLVETGLIEALKKEPSFIAVNCRLDQKHIADIAR